MKGSAALRLVAAGTVAFAAGVVSLAWLAGSAGSAASATRAWAEPASGESLYELDSEWLTDDGRAIRLRELGGRFQVLAMIFTRCPGVCPTLVRELKALEQKLPEAVRDNTGFLLVSIDPEHDTPQVLREYRQTMGLGDDRWTLLRGEPTDLRELAATLGFNYEPSDSGFAHSRLVTVLDPGGEIVHRQADPGEDPMRVVSAIQKRL
jgi:protein SCO1/2